MRAQQLPQPVAARLLDMDARLAELMAEAQEADAKVAYARGVINGKDNSVSAAAFEQERALSEPLSGGCWLRERAETQRKVGCQGAARPA